MTSRFLNDEARTAFADAIKTLEEASGAEIVVAVRRRSATYRHANVVVGAAFAFAGLAAMLFSSHPFALGSILIDPFAVGIGFGALVELMPGVKRQLTTSARRRELVARAARATFVERGVHGTLSRGGLLVYISWLEQEVALVPDTGLARTIAPDALADLERKLASAMRAGGVRVASTLATFGPELARAMPRRHDDVNELPDAIDSDMEPT